VIGVERDASVAIVVVDRQEALNALDPPTLAGQELTRPLWIHHATVSNDNQRSQGVDAVRRRTLIADGHVLSFR